MKLIRHILSHTILIGFVAALVVGFYYRAALFPATWNERISQQIDRVPGTYSAKLHAFAAPVTPGSVAQVASAPAPQVISPPVEIPAAVPPAAVPQSEIAQANIPEPTPAEVAPPAEVAMAPIPPAAEPVQTSPGPELNAPVPMASEAPAVAENAAAESAITPTPAPLAQAAAPSEVMTAPAAEDDTNLNQGGSDRDFVGINDLWLQARAAYGRGDLTSALQHYLTLSQQESDNPDVFGELGNVYYTRGNFAEAGQAYYEAAVRLLEQGQMGQMQYLVRVIEGLSPDNAEKLKQRLVR